MPKLRALRYKTASNEWLAKAIEEELFLLDYEEARAWYAEKTREQKLDDDAMRLLGCNDRYFLLTGILARKDANHHWLFDRCREVERDPDGHLDLWARGHFKSTIITFAGSIQEILCDPEIRIAIFSVIRPIAQAFLSQIKEEFESNELLKRLYADLLYENPRGTDLGGRPPKWSLARGITVKRKDNPKEATIEAHGLLDGQPTSRHYPLMIFDDVVTQDYLSDDAIKKTTLRWEMADNLATHLLARKQVAGTFYHFNDTYVQIRARGSLKPRIYPATDDGMPEGKPVLLSPERWEHIKRDQRSTVSAQMLLNPIAGNEATFSSLWLQTYELIPAMLNVYILVDPSKGHGMRSDRTAIVVVGIDQGGTKYLLDGYRHRMRFSERWDAIKAMKRKWEEHPGVQMVKIGYEQFGAQDDISVMQNFMDRERHHFEIVELGSPEAGRFSKADRIDRLEPDFKSGRFLLPCIAYNADAGGDCFWSVWTEAHRLRAEQEDTKHDIRVGEITYRATEGKLTKRQEFRKGLGQSFRVVYPIKRRDENDDIYDLTRVFIDEFVRHPFAPHDDLIDATARIYDIQPLQPTTIERELTEPIGIEESDTSAPTDAEFD